MYCITSIDGRQYKLNEKSCIAVSGLMNTFIQKNQQINLSNKIVFVSDNNNIVVGDDLKNYNLIVEVIDSFRDKKNI